MLACSRPLRPPLGTVIGTAGCGYAFRDRGGGARIIVVGDEFLCRLWDAKLIAGPRAKLEPGMLGRQCGVRQAVAPDTHTATGLPA